MHEHDSGTLAPKSKDSKKSSTQETKVFDGLIHPCKDEDGKPSVAFNYRRYEHLLAETTITPEEKRRVIEAVWDIVTSFIRLGFGIHPAQAALNAQRDKKRDAIDASSAAGCGEDELSNDAESLDLINSIEKEDV